MPSKKIDDRRTSVDVLRSLIRDEGETLVRGLEELFEGELETGEKPPELGSFPVLLVRVVVRHLRRLSEADWAVDQALVEERQRRKELHAKTRRMRDDLIHIRKMFGGWFGKARADEMVGVKGPTPHDSLTLLRLAQHLVWNLDAGQIPASPKPGTEDWPQKFVERLRGEAEALDNADNALNEACRGIEGSRFDRERLLDVFNDNFTDVAGLFEFLFRLIGKPHLARRLRPSRQEKGLTLKAMKQRRTARAPHRRDEAPSEPEDSR